MEDMDLTMAEALRKVKRITQDIHETLDEIENFMWGSVYESLMLSQYETSIETEEKVESNINFRVKTIISNLRNSKK